MNTLGKPEDPAFHSADERHTKALSFDDISKPYFSSDEPIVVSSTLSHSSKFFPNINSSNNNNLHTPPHSHSHQTRSPGRSPGRSPSFTHADHEQTPASPPREKPKPRQLSFLEYVKDEVLIN